MGKDRQQKLFNMPKSFIFSSFHIYLNSCCIYTADNNGVFFFHQAFPIVIVVHSDRKSKKNRMVIQDVLDFHMNCKNS